MELFKCKQCNKEYESIKAFKEHLSTKKGDKKCTSAGYELAGDSSPDAPKPKVTETVKTEEVKAGTYYRCNICGEEFSTINLFKKHNSKCNAPGYEKIVKRGVKPAPKSTDEPTLDHNPKDALSIDPKNLKTVKDTKADKLMGKTTKVTKTPKPVRPTKGKK